MVPVVEYRTPFTEHYDPDTGQAKNVPATQAVTSSADLCCTCLLTLSRPCDRICRRSSSIQLDSCACVDVGHGGCSRLENGGPRMATLIRKIDYIIIYH